MRPSVVVLTAVLLLTAIMACAVQPVAASTGPTHPSQIVVHEFAVSPAIVTLDPSFGFSLYRGSRGVPPLRRATSVARAAAFTLADAITQRLIGAGYDALHVPAGTAEPGGPALVVSGVFRHIYEGHRRQNARAAVAVTVDYQPNGRRQRMALFNLDSRRFRNASRMSMAERHGHDVNYEVTRLGMAIGRYVANLVRAHHWPSMTRAPRR